MQTTSTIGARPPRLAGSPWSAAARQYLLDTLTGMGLRPEVQTARGVTRFPGANGVVHPLRRVAARGV